MSPVKPRPAERAEAGIVLRTLGQALGRPVLAGTLRHGWMPLLRGARRIQAGKPEHGAPPFGETVACML